MVENTTACIRLARQSKYYVTYSDAEFEYVSSHQALSANEKLIWFNLARKSLLDPNMSCVMTHNQIAKMIGVSYDVVYRAVRNLKLNNFLEVYFDQNRQLNTFTLKLPSDGLEVIQNAPNRRSKEERIEVSPSKIADTPPVILQTTPCKNTEPPPAEIQNLLINNNINNKYNNLDAFGGNFSSDPKTAGINKLVCEYKNFEKLYLKLPFKERIKSLKSHFSSEDWAAIHEQILQNQDVGPKKHNLSNTVDLQLSEKRLGQKEQRLAKSEPCKLKVIQFEGITYCIEEDVKNRILNDFPSLYKEKISSGKAMVQPLQELLKEVFYFVTKIKIKKANSGSKEILSQLHKYHIARKKFIEGKWETPYTISCQSSLQREEEWNQKKINEIQSSKTILAATDYH